MDLFSKWLPAAGLFGLALYSLSIGDLNLAAAHLVAGLAVLGITVKLSEQARKVKNLEGLHESLANCMAFHMNEVNNEIRGLKKKVD